MNNKEQAEQGDAVAQTNLRWGGLQYAKGQGYTKAVSWYRKAAEQGYAKAQYNLGLMYSQEQDYTKAVSWFRKAAEQGYAEAQYNLGVMYDNGSGVKKDTEQAVYWFRKAAEQGFAQAQGHAQAQGNQTWHWNGEVIESLLYED